MHGSKGDCHGPFVTYNGTLAKLNMNFSKGILFCKHLTSFYLKLIGFFLYKSPWLKYCKPTLFASEKCLRVLREPFCRVLFLFFCFLFFFIGDIILAYFCYWNVDCIHELIFCSFLESESMLRKDNFYMHTIQ